MIIPKLYGRLGNQCFQIAAAIAHANKMETTWAIPRRTEDLRYWPNYFLNEVPLNNRRHFFDVNNYNELRHCYDPLPTTKDLTLNGYFQSEKYWPALEQKTIIGNALGFHCNKQDYIAVHVRRGDYVNLYSEKWPPLDMDYYNQAIEYFIEHGYDNFRVYSDDINYCKQEFCNNIGWNVTYSSIKDPLSDMRDMYNAGGFIISNSTFSLFPALLRLDNPVVVAPAEHRWFGPDNAHLETIDLMPERFIKI